MSETLAGDLRRTIRNVPDYPKKGIVFRDITTVLLDPDLTRRVIRTLAESIRTWRVDRVVGIESRGFIFGMPLAVELGIGFVPVRKKGKLPYRKHSAKYGLEYGTDEVEMHTDAVLSGHRVAVVDDLLATGGTANAACELVRASGGTVAGLAFVIELGFLKGRARLNGAEVRSLLTYDSA